MFTIIERRSRNFVDKNYKCIHLYTLKDSEGYLCDNIDDLMSAATREELLPCLDVLALTYPSNLLDFFIVEFQVEQTSRLTRTK